ncbi:hypothetical protein SAMN04488109_5624 [Chryseolinea serpens]|uniref:Uncharacterized protein n=1 Tax=Chryseolinea serpens TaxID=947013 RepID=A0A1M5WE31_9BACT|nr:hypothetical protein [Chryseolinea serpens]SHH85829.1 hypothetical protein SAMN04488109_5624 [Chryseolinea serpens]
MSPQDVAVLLKIVSYGEKPWQQKHLAEALHLSQSEISKSLARSRYAALLDDTGKKVHRQALLEFLQFGIAYVFPALPGPIVRGTPTAHSAPPLNTMIQADHDYVWPSAKGRSRGQAIAPLYENVPKAVQNDHKLYELLCLVDGIRAGRVREKQLAVEELKKRLLLINAHG